MCTCPRMPPLHTLCRTPPNAKRARGVASPQPARSPGTWRHKKLRHMRVPRRRSCSGRRWANSTPLAGGDAGRRRGEPSLRAGQWLRKPLPTRVSLIRSVQCLLSAVCCRVESVLQRVSPRLLCDVTHSCVPPDVIPCCEWNHWHNPDAIAKGGSPGQVLVCPGYGAPAVQAYFVQRCGECPSDQEACDCVWWRCCGLFVCFSFCFGLPLVCEGRGLARVLTDLAISPLPPPCHWQHQTSHLPVRFVHAHDGHLFAFKLGAIRVTKFSRRWYKKQAFAIWKVGVCCATHYRLGGTSQVCVCVYVCV